MEVQSTPVFLTSLASALGLEMNGKFLCWTSLDYFEVYYFDLWQNIAEKSDSWVPVLNPKCYGHMLNCLCTRFVKYDVITEK